MVFSLRHNNREQTGAVVAADRDSSPIDLLVSTFAERGSIKVDRDFLIEFRGAVSDVWDGFASNARIVPPVGIGLDDNELGIQITPREALRQNFDSLCSAIRECTTAAALTFRTEKESLYIIGDDGSSLRMKTAEVGNHNARVVRPVMDCILFVSEKEARRIDRDLYSLAGLGVGVALTMSPIDVIEPALGAVPLELVSETVRIAQPQAGPLQLLGRITNCHLGHGVVDIIPRTPPIDFS